MTESLGGGTQSAIADYVAHVPEAQHFLLACARQGESTRDLPGLAGHRTVGRGTVGIALNLARALQDFRPDIVHLHSSGAGLLRLVPFVGARIVYTPHCYAFERTDLSSRSRRGVRLVEAIAARSAATVAAVSPHEADLARALGSRGPVVYVPNVVPGVPPEGVRPWSDPVRVVVVGRITSQKDPDFLIRILDHLGPVARRRFEVTWVGGGRDSLVRRLEEAHVRVTGWLPQAAVEAELASAAVYLHTAAWESAPLSVLEAVGAGLLPVLRSLDSLDSLGLPTAGWTPRAVADSLLFLEQSEVARARWWAQVRRAASSLTREGQRLGLTEAYAA